MGNELFTIGYAPHGLESFLRILHKYRITAVADVRSSPYSRFKPEFNKDRVAGFLAEQQIAYVFLGDYCGARVEDPACYVDGRVDYALVAETPKFKEGLQRIIAGMEKFRLALMCAEKDPLACHRTILICRNLAATGIGIRHVLGNGGLEEHRASEVRLLELFGLDRPDLFRTELQRLAEAYARQGGKIAFAAAEPDPAGLPSP